MFDSEGIVTLGRLVLGSGYRNLRSCWHPPTRRLEAWCLEGCGQRPGETAVVITSRKQDVGARHSRKEKGQRREDRVCFKECERDAFFLLLFLLTCFSSWFQNLLQIGCFVFSAQLFVLFSFFFLFFWEEVVERHNLYLSLLRSSLRNVVARRLWVSFCASRVLFCFFLAFLFLVCLLSFSRGFCSVFLCVFRCSRSLLLHFYLPCPASGIAGVFLA